MSVFSQNAARASNIVGKNTRASFEKQGFLPTYSTSGKKVSGGTVGLDQRKEGSPG